MLASHTYVSSDKNNFRIDLIAINASRRSPNEYFCVRWSVYANDYGVINSLIVKFTDPILYQHGIKTWRDIETGEIKQASKIAEVLLQHLVVIETGRDTDHTIRFFFADRPDGDGPFDGAITWTHLGGLRTF